MQIKPCEVSGVIVINKPEGITSHTVVNKIRRIFGTRQVGHTGTLDPMATGVLPILIGRAVKASEYLSESGKAYLAVMRLGIETDTEDITGRVINSSSNIPKSDLVFETVKSFERDIEQIPPMYSALKVGGRKLVDMARKGLTVERQSRTVTIHKINCTKLSESDYVIDVKCSKGTYIRTLCADIGKKLGCGAVMTSLCRSESAGFSLADSYTIEKLESMSEQELVACVVPIEKLFYDLPRVTYPDFYAKLSKSGCEIYQSKIKTDFKSGQRVALYDRNGFFALGEVRDYPDGSAIKSIKLFVL
jgi:tRNA pseudouridine55 synthase